MLARISMYSFYVVACHEAFGTGAGVLSRTVRSLALRLSG